MALYSARLKVPSPMVGNLGESPDFLSMEIMVDGIQAKSMKRATAEALEEGDRYIAYRFKPSVIDQLPEAVCLQVARIGKDGKPVNKDFDMAHTKITMHSMKKSETNIVPSSPKVKTAVKEAVKKVVGPTYHALEDPLTVEIQQQATAPVFGGTEDQEAVGL